MLKKIIVLAVLGGMAYVGYLVWTEHLSERDKATIKKKLSDTGKKIKKGTSKLAKEAADVVKEGLKDEDDKKGEESDEHDGKEAGASSEPEKISAEDEGREQDE